MKSEGGHPVGGGEAMLPDEVGQSAIPPNRYVWQSVCPARCPLARDVVGDEVVSAASSGLPQVGKAQDAYPG